MCIMNKTIPDEKKINHLRDVFSAIIIGCLILLVTWGLVDGKLMLTSDEVGKTEQSK